MRDDVTGWRKLPKYELHNLYSSLNSVMMIKWRMKGRIFNTKMI